jgi:hypothetical protein
MAFVIMVRLPVLSRVASPDKSTRSPYCCHRPPKIDPLSTVAIALICDCALDMSLVFSASAALALVISVSRFEVKVWSAASRAVVSAVVLALTVPHNFLRPLLRGISNQTQHPN